MKCTNCGKDVSETANVCGYCGHRLKSTQVPVAAAPLHQVTQSDSAERSSIAPTAPRPGAGNINISQMPAVRLENNQAAGWGYTNWITGALIWTIAYLIATLAWAAIIYLTDPSLKSRWNGMWEFYVYSFGGVPWLGALLIWGVPGALTGGTYKSGVRMLWGFVSIPLGVLLGVISIVAGFEFQGFIVQIRQGWDMAPALGALIVLWSGLHISTPSGFPSILRWILLIWCGIIVGVWSMQLIFAAFNLYNNTYAPFVFALVGVVLAVYTGMRERKRDAML